MKKLFLILIFLVFTVFAITLFLKNGQQVTVSYYFNFEQAASLASVMIMTFACGLIMGAFIVSISLFKSKHIANKAKKQLSKIEKEVDSFRALPIKNSV